MYGVHISPSACAGVNESTVHLEQYQKEGGLANQMMASCPALSFELLEFITVKLEVPVVARLRGSYNDRLNYLETASLV